MKNKKHLFKTALFILGIVILFPVILVGIWSICGRWPWPNILPEFLSLRGLREIIGSHSGAFKILISSVFISFASAIISTIIGLMASRAFTLYEFKGKAILQFGSMLPIIVPANVFAMGIHVIFIRWGLNDNIYGVLICHIIYSLPYTISILTDITESIGKTYEEQAYVLGCNPLKAFADISFPLMLPAILSSVSMAYIISFSQYFLTLIIGGGRIKTFSIIMVPFISGGDRVIASAYVILFLFSSLIVFALFEFAAKKIATVLKG